MVDANANQPALALQMTATSDSPEQTRGMGRHLGTLCQGGEVVLLQGDLGSGKTCLVQGLAEGLGIETRVTSPTFTIHAEYDGRLVLNHVDLYRLDEPCGLDGLGIMEMLGDSRAVAAIEWPEILGDIPGERLVISITDLGEGRREIALAAYGRGHTHLLNG